MTYKYRFGNPSGNTRRFAMGTAVLLVTLISSCRTVLPEGPYRDVLGWLPPESDVMLRLQVQGNEELAAMLMASAGVDSEDLDPVMERAAVVAVGMETSDDGEQVIHLATIGKWPKALGTVLGRDWKKVSKRRWAGPEGVELSIPTGEELFLSDGKMDTMLDRAEADASAPVAFASGNTDIPPDLEAWIVDPEGLMEEGGVMTMLSAAGIVIDRLGLELRRSDEGLYDARVFITPEDGAMAARLVLPMRLGLSARFGLSPDEKERALLQQMDIVVEGGSLIIGIPGMDMGVLGNLASEVTPDPEETE